jgi:hypothetical protein
MHQYKPSKQGAEPPYGHGGAAVPATGDVAPDPKPFLLYLRMPSA